MKKDYTIDDCMIDALTARDINEFLRRVISQEEAKKTIVLSSEALSGLEKILNVSNQCLNRVIWGVEKISLKEFKEKVSSV